jgi:hypothetical protein
MSAEALHRLSSSAVARFTLTRLCAPHIRIIVTSALSTPCRRRRVGVRRTRSQGARGPGQSRSRDFATPYPAHIFFLTCRSLIGRL